MYKTLLFAVIAVFSFEGRSDPKRYMLCLAQEEAMIHKNNIGGAVYKLNQELIGSLVQLGDSLYMKKRYVDLVCKAPYPSIKLLELLMTEDRVFFSIFTEERTPKMLAIDESSLAELKQQSAPLFVNFIARIQAGLSSSGCLQRHIPQLDRFFEKMQFLQENMGLEKIIDTMDSPAEIFEKLQKTDFKKIKCRGR